MLPVAGLEIARQHAAAGDHAGGDHRLQLVDPLDLLVEQRGPGDEVELHDREPCCVVPNPEVDPLQPVGAGVLLTPQVLDVASDLVGMDPVDVLLLLCERPPGPTLRCRGGGPV